MTYLWLEIQYSVFSIRPLSLENEAILKCNSGSLYFNSLLNVFLKIMGMALAVRKKKGCDNTLRCSCWCFFLKVGSTLPNEQIVLKPFDKCF